MNLWRTACYNVAIKLYMHACTAEMPVHLAFITAIVVVTPKDQSKTQRSRIWSEGYSFRRM